ncbi:acetyl/propionyl/methylcrotonyl-CoA carboxylase subunit alpha [Sneathiella sp.]|uniref:acetyl-CoA carboxylase biotin carboxylase subunit n=1 Tax=Sneathiella sp. TaxID=1964365 RepID=UPI0035695BE2
MKKILIANRGEIACRIARTCRQMGIQTVAVHSDVDAHALHVKNADQSVAIGPAPAASSYLDKTALINAALSTGAEAIHPGYGFLSESGDFAQAVEAAGLIWIGPPPQTLRDMGDKNQARHLATAAGVPVLPASAPWDGGDMQPLLQAANEIGFPLLVKAAGGGGGIGMRRVDTPDKLEATVSATHSQAARSFGSGKVYVEKFIQRSRHIEVQVFGTGDGRAVALWDRDCSVQRRFQKVIEEAPAADISPEHRKAMSDAAVTLAKATSYRSAGTVEFIVDADTGNFFFLEMNTRIQVEHGITEMILGVDLVERQLKLANGEISDNLLSVPEPRGVAIEARIYAENPAKGFLPQPGTLNVFVLPEGMENVRIDTGVTQGDSVTPFYDPMIAKVMAFGSDRNAAIDRLHDALAAIRLDGLASNLPFLIRSVLHPVYRAGPVCTDFITTYQNELVNDPD